MATQLPTESGTADPITFAVYGRRFCLRSGFRHISICDLAVGTSEESFIVVLGRPFVKRSPKNDNNRSPYATRPLSVCLSCPVCNVGVLWPNGWTDQDVGLTWRAGSLGPDHSVLDRDPGPPPPKGHSPLQFSAHICSGEIARWIKMPLDRKVDLDSSDIVLDGNPPPPPPKRGRPPIFGHVYCRQKAAWIKMPLGMEVGLALGHIVLDGDPTPPSKKGQSPQFSAYVC